MAELTFESRVTWWGRERAGTGILTMGREEVVFSAPSSMGGRGVGTSPEELLVSAVASCYAGTLFHLLARDGLPAEQVRVRATGMVTEYPGSTARFSQIVVQPTIRGGEPRRATEYTACARTARQHCFIGKALREDITYEVGEVSVQPAGLVHVEVA
ncbi:MAG: OsmC family protein [Candidatus Dormibacteria bacterium]